ncbi:AraC family transcriptional regulator [Enterococcus thailandicus]|uniref:AraC family transcriptional regulator n=1 Tax=Enterococcus thailandicus TaxID=417368 RepID=A0A510WAQ3_ENTTH|nr:AraC family transcriptional regulator [Enterococcus thailandicus]MDK4351153.1 AraC family transcriptional regulator [Enterococcus thailandicus]MDT2733197.1 AraC family transcriptional regulator [Enterococcus thailandicus]MDT2750805.1 AraC family transcriptional regulator [Enterococcus thailandicus]MDT2775364.1 AraC family transcriptional regulator [Enterococcus thailandicus]MEA4829535.1 AraC family transcriptional regulator [Enterococcus thailandicus]
MSYANAQIFNPEIIYAFDPWNEEGNKSDIHTHDFLEISIVLEGQANYTIEEQEFQLNAGQIMLFNPGTHHGEEQRTGTYSHQLHIGLTNISLDGLKRNHLPTKKAILNLGEYQWEFLDKAWRLVKEYSEEQPEFQLMVKALIIEMLVLILRSLEKVQDNTVTLALSKNAKRKQYLVNHAIYYLENHHTQEITLEQLADTLYVSPTYLSKVFKESTGMSPINYLIQVRLKHAKELLANEQLTIREISQAVGYQDAYHFSKLFKKYYGVSPSQLAKKSLA